MAVPSASVPTRPKPPSNHGLLGRISHALVSGVKADYEILDKAGTQIRSKLTPGATGAATAQPLRGQDVSIADYLGEAAREYDPRTTGGAVNLLGLLGGPRVPGPFGRGMGFGHAEKTYPSVLEGHTLVRAGDKELFKTYRENEWDSHQTMGRGYYDKGVRARSRGIPLVYNLVRDSDGQIVGSIDMVVHKDRTNVHQAWLDEDYQKTRAFFDFIKIARNTGKPIYADFANAKLAAKMGKASRNDPQLADFRRHDPGAQTARERQWGRSSRDSSYDDQYESENPFDWRPDNGTDALGSHEPDEYHDFAPGSALPPHHPGVPESWLPYDTLRDLARRGVHRDASGRWPAPYLNAIEEAAAPAILKQDHFLRQRVDRARERQARLGEYQQIVRNHPPTR